MHRIKSSLALFGVLTGLMLLSSCKAELKITTNEAELDCAVLLEDTYCIKVRNGQINSVKDLAIIEDQILTGESGFSLSWKMPATAKGILATRIVLASDAACTEELKSVEIPILEQTHSFTDLKDGVYYGCVFAKARAAGLLGANNNGIKILVEAAKPKIDLPSEVFYTNGKGPNQELNITSLSALTYEWRKISGPGELSFSPVGSARPTITASVDGSYTVALTATNEVGGRATKTFTLVYDSTPPVLKAIAPILTSANSVAIQAESEEDLALYRWELISAPADATPVLKDANSATAELSLPSLGLYELKVSLSDQAGNVGSTQVLITKEAPAAPPVDTTNPSAPSAITVAVYTNTTSVSASYTAGSDANFSTHNVKACAASDCSTACLGVSQDIASPVTVSSLLNGSSYYICLQAVDLSGNVSAYVASGNSVTVDTTLPVAPSSLGFGSSFTTSTTFSLAFAVGTDTNFSTHDTRLCTASDCNAGCGSVVQSMSSPVSLTGTAGATYYGCARSRDLAGNTSSWIASIGTMTIDSTNPTAPSAITVATHSNQATVNVTYTAGTDLNFSSHNVKACTASDCNTGCLSVTQDALSPVTVSSLVNGTAYYICLQTVDLAANTSAYVPSGNSVLVDTSLPTAPSAIAWAAGYSNSPTASLSWTNGSDSNFATHNLKACTDSGCSASCTAETQDAATPGSIAGMSGGSTYYACLQTIDLAGNTSAWVASAGTTTIDVTNPAGPSAITVAPHSNQASVDVTYTAGTDIHFSSHNVKACTASDCTTGCLSVTQDALSPVTVSSLVDGTAYYICLQTVDLAANTSAYVPSGNSVLVDMGLPSAPSAIAWAAAYSNSPTASLSWTNGSDSNFATHNLKACTDSGCSASCTAETQDAATPGSIAGMSGGSSYYACLQTVDLAGNTSAWVASAGTTTIDITNPAGPSAITVAPHSNQASVDVTYTAGTDLNFSSHNVKACTASDCNTGCLSVIQDALSPVTVSSLVNGTAYYICLQTIDLAANTSAYVPSGNSVLVDTSLPTAPSAIAWAAGYSNSPTASLSWTNGSDSNFATHNLKACTDSGCSASCTAETQDAASPGTITGMTAGSSYYACLQSIDLAGNASAFVASAGTVTIDTTVPLDPTVVSVPVASNGNFNISFTAGAETHPSSFNIMACTSGCTVGCVGATSTAASPGTISGAALSNGNSYHGCVQGTDLAGNSSGWVPSVGLVIFDTMAPNGASDLLVPAYSNSSSVTATFTVGTDANMSTHNFKACTSNNCATGCLTDFQAASSPATLTSLVNGTAYYACAQAVDLAGNTSSFSFSPATVTIDTTNPGNPSAVSVPTSSASNFNITFTGGTEINPASYNIKACTSSDCATGCVGETTAASSPGTISAAALTLGNSYYGCVQGTDLAGNTSSFVASAGTVLYNSFTVTYSGNANTGGSVPTDATGYASGATVTVLGNTGSLVRSGYNFAGWNTAADGSGTAYSPGQTFSITAHSNLYAQWDIICTSLAGGSYVVVPGSSVYGTSAFCLQKYAASNVAGVATSQAGSLPWVNINQTDSIAQCAVLGNGFHLVSNPQWMTVAANLANVGSNWSLGIVGGGTLRRGHADNNPANACAADASDVNAYVETDCVGTSSGTFVERRTSTLSNGSVVWDIGGNVRNWLNYFNRADKPTPAAFTVNDFKDITGSAGTPKAHLVPINSVQSWWSDSWTASEGIGKIYPGTNGSGGALARGGSWFDLSVTGSFAALLDNLPLDIGSHLGFRCAYIPNTLAVTYNANNGTSGSPPNDATLYAPGATVTVKDNVIALARTGYTFGGWNTLANGTGTNYSPGSTFTISANTTLYARWITCAELVTGGTWVEVPGDSVYGTTSFCVQKYAASDVGGVATSQAGTTPWNSTRANAIASCSALGAGYHLITNPQWMTIAANLANVGSNWSGSSVGSGTLRRGHADSNPSQPCAAHATDSNGYVQTDCTGTSSGTFLERRTATLSNSAVVWDIGGNIFQWIDYTNTNDKPTPDTAAWYEFTAMTWTPTTPKSHMLPLNSVQAWWSDSWSSATGIGSIFPGINGTGGNLLRGGGYCSSANAGSFAAYLNASSPSCSGANIGFRCAKTP